MTLEPCAGGLREGIKDKRGGGRRDRIERRMGGKECGQWGEARLGKVVMGEGGRERLRMKGKDMKLDLRGEGGREEQK